MAKATYDFPADIAFRDAARRILLLQFHKMMDNAPGTRAGEDIEALHDMRVGSRRLRAALSVFAKVFPKDEYRMLDKQIGDITDALGAVRDLDVQLDYLRNYRNSLPENEAYGITRLIERRGGLRDSERKKLVKALDRLEKEKFSGRFRKALDKAVPGTNDPVLDEERAGG
jgi:CHAD domain-containing protein|uniref:Adenylate cyclase n=1 Tax=uncultured Armatimonadetes bacterium TaxID=157466 RepID=A0A6J4JB19_9BACT|nr:Adenylate cyclase [uncultured Armatimonadetes bacterium]